MSGIHLTFFSMAGLQTSNTSSSGLNAITIRFFLYVESTTSCPTIAAWIAVMRCCPSIRIFLPDDIVPSFNLTSGFFHTMIYPTGKPLYNESIRSRTLDASHTKGRWISGIAISPDLIELIMLSTEVLFTSNCAMCGPLSVYTLEEA